LQDLVGWVETRVLGGPALQGRLAVLELDFYLAAPKDFVLLVQEDHRLDALGQVDDGSIAGAHQLPFWAKVGVEGENPVAVGIRAHVQFVNQGMVIREGALEGQVLTGHPLDLLFFVLIFLVLVIFFDFVIAY
jgi:hypothetical protein